MNKYTFIVLGRQREDFLARLQGLGLVDVTITDREPSEEDRALMEQIEARREAVEYLAARAKADVNTDTTGVPYGTGTEAFDNYRAARREIEALDAEIARCEKSADEARPWGDLDTGKLRQLIDAGVSLDLLLEAAGVEKPEEIRLPDESVAQIEAKIAAMKAEHADREKVLARAAAAIPAIEADGEALRDLLQFNRTKRSGSEAAEGSIVVMEAWAREKQEAEVDAMLEAYPGVLHVKERPSPDDETPVELKNNSFASPFEFIGDLYAKPKYGTMDLTRWFAPFFMIFFGMCMGDLGYGMILLLGGLWLTLKSPEKSMKQIGRLTMWCGGAAVVVGFMMGGMFGTSLAGWNVFEPVKSIFISSNSMFYVAIGVGIFQVMFAMVLNIVMTSRAFGIKHALDTIGWLMVMVTCISSFALQAIGIKGFGEGGMFAPGSVLFYIFTGAGLFLMLFFNSPGKNPLVNFGAGLWATFNRLTGLLGDALSYIRLFAIGLAGGILGQVFNTIAADISGDVPVLSHVIMLLILLIGHALNLFLSTLSSVVHPLRLTFVEFFNNAGFEATERVFEPLKRNVNEPSK